MVSACDPGGALWLACGPASLYCPGYDRPHALRADPGLPGVSWPGDSSGVASHAPPEYERLSFEAYQPVLDQVCALLPTGHRITLLADRGFVHEQLLRTLQKFQWHFRLRLPGDTLVHLGAHHMAAVKDLCPKARTHSVLPAGGDFRSSCWTRFSGSSYPA